MYKRQAQDNLEGQNPGVNSRCQPWEIFDPTLSAAGRGGGQGGIESSGIGCIRVCYVEFHHAALTSPVTIQTVADDINLLSAEPSAPGTPELANTNNGWLLFSRSDIFDIHKPSPATAGKSVLPVSGRISVDGNGNAKDSATDDDALKEVIKNIKGSGTDNFEIRVANNQRYCGVWDNTTDQQEFRSEN